MRVTNRKTFLVPNGTVHLSRASAPETAEYLPRVCDGSGIGHDDVKVLGNATTERTSIVPRDGRAWRLRVVTHAQAISHLPCETCVESKKQHDIQKYAGQGIGYNRMRSDEIEETHVISTITELFLEPYDLHAQRALATAPRIDISKDGKTSAINVNIHTFAG